MTRALRNPWLEPSYRNLRRMEDAKHVENKTCSVCDSISATTTFTAKAYQENLKIQTDPSSCDPENVLYLLKCRTCGKVPYVEKPISKFTYR